jgi:hypothetical protein
MNVASKLLLAALAFGACSTSASAVVALNHSTGLSLHPGVGAGETMVWNFDAIHDTAHFSYTGSTFSSTTSMAAEPAGDTTTYGAGEPADMGGSATFQVLPGFQINSLSFDLGSLDTYNTISFYSGITLLQSYGGTSLTVPNPADGEQAGDANNRRYYFTFGAADNVNRVVFASTTPAFEFDNIAATLVSAVPEPATWTMMILGFGFVGFMMRGNRRKAVAFAA